MARAPFIGWLNADDVYEPGALAAVVRFFREHPEAFLVNGHLVRVDSAGNQLEFLPGEIEPLLAAALLVPLVLAQSSVDVLSQSAVRRDRPDRHAAALRDGLRFLFAGLTAIRVLRHRPADDADAGPSRRQDEPRLGQFRRRRAADARQGLEAAASAVLRLFAARRADVRGPQPSRRIVHRPARRPAKDALRELGRAAAWWPLLPLLPSFYTYCGRDGIATASWANHAIRDCAKGSKAGKRPQPAHAEPLARFSSLVAPSPSSLF